MFTYGDGISDVNLNKLLKFHNSKKKLITVTAVRPGEILRNFDKEIIKLFHLKKNHKLLIVG